MRTYTPQYRNNPSTTMRTAALDFHATRRKPGSAMGDARTTANSKETIQRRICVRQHGRDETQNEQDTLLLGTIHILSAFQSRRRVSPPQQATANINSDSSIFCPPSKVDDASLLRSKLPPTSTPTHTLESVGTNRRTTKRPRRGSDQALDIRNDIQDDECGGYFYDPDA